MKPFLFFLFTFSFFSQTQLLSLVSSATTTIPHQLITLLSIKSSLIDPLNHLNDWKNTSSNSNNIWCSWRGISCHPKTTQITSLNLSNLNLTGIISLKIRYLTTLTHLDISGNDFNGCFQAAIFQLTELVTLDISHNSFNSTFPKGISKLRFLRIFNAYSNNFIGPLPEELAGFPFLEKLNLGESYFNGTIPASYGNFERLKFLYLAGNALEGSVPPELGLLSELQHLDIGYNKFSGTLPVELTMLSNLKYLDISSSNISGQVIPELGNLTMLEKLYISKNRLSGEIPSNIGQLESLQYLDLSDNELTGSIPSEITMLKELRWMNLMLNKLKGEIPQGIGELPKLNTIQVFNNSLIGRLPPKLGSNGLLQRIDVSTNLLQGSIPINICKGNNLVKLILFDNNFTNTLPSSLNNCTSLTKARIQNNKLNGPIPQTLTMLPKLTFLDLSNNNFNGKIPQKLGNLRYLNISGNSFESELPSNIWNSTNLQIFSASFSKITGRIPNFIGCQNIYWIELQGNSINGTIPRNIGDCEKLIQLNLSKNYHMTGTIPDEISTIPSISELNLSQNNITGPIPSTLTNCINLAIFNVSFNNLTGPIPSSGIFPDLNQSSYNGNQNLCGRPLDKPCAIDDSENEPGVHRKKKIDGTTVRGVIFGMILWVIVIFAGAYFYKKYSSRYKRNANQGDGLWEFTAFQRLNFTIDDLFERMETADIIGKGSTGTVHKAEMPGGEIIAVKVILTKQDTVSTIKRRGVLAEVGVLGGNVRHRNIVRLLGCCSNKEKTMLLYNYMENGNLDEFLHAENNGDNTVNASDWVTRYKIALGVAHGISYLHHDCNPVVVHRDIKPSNILLDGQMEAKVADFGIAKLIQIDELESTIIGTHGYIAPENAERLQVDERTDIYSYGVVLMELISGKRALNEEFGEGKNIVDWVDSKLKTEDGIDGILDKNAGADRDSVKKEMTNMLRIALLCTSRHRANRPSMRDVLSMLQKQKYQPRRELNDIDIYNFDVGEGSGDGQT